MPLSQSSCPYVTYPQPLDFHCVAHHSLTYSLPSHLTALARHRSSLTSPLYQIQYTSYVDRCRTDGNQANTVAVVVYYIVDLSDAALCGERVLNLDSPKQRYFKRQRRRFGSIPVVLEAATAELGQFLLSSLSLNRNYVAVICSSLLPHISSYTSTYV